MREVEEGGGEEWLFEGKQEGGWREAGAMNAAAYLQMLLRGEVPARQGEGELRLQRKGCMPKRNCGEEEDTVGRSSLLEQLATFGIEYGKSKFTHWYS